MSGIIKVILLGKVGKAPAEDRNKDGIWLCSTLVTSEVISKTGVEQEYSHELRVSIDNPALKRTTIKMHDIIFVEGKLQTRSFFSSAKHQTLHY